MNRHDATDLYMRGWVDGDVGTIIRTLADGYVFDNPRVGKVTKAHFEAYFAELLKMVAAMRGGAHHETFMEVTSTMRDDDGTTLSMWMWWRIPGTKLEGASLSTATDQGVVSHRMA